LLIFAIITGNITAGAANVLKGNSALIEAPDGMAYDSSLSAKMDMDVYRNHDNSLIFALGSQPANEGVNAITLAAVLAGTSAGSVVKIADRDVYAAFDGTRNRVFGICQTSGAMPLVLIIGDIDRNDALRWISTLRAIDI